MICAAVLAALHQFALQGLLSSQHPDVLPFWLPTWCHLGKSLAGGHIPVWNPAVMGGIPFAADPQSGWLYLPPMVLFSALPCDAAIQVFIVLQPIAAGLGLYWFLRSEGLSRSAATVGGLALALPISSSIFVLSLPFAGMFAWTPLLLACASRLLRSPAWPGRLLWLGAAALCWGQLASAHLSHGLVLGTGALVAFVVARLTQGVRGGHRSFRSAVPLAGLMVMALPLVNLAVLLPRLAYLPHTTLGEGYARLDALSSNLGAYSVDKVITAGLAPSFPLKLIKSPGFYFGALALGLCFAGFWHRRHRHVALAFSVYGVICYVISLDAVVHGLGQVVGTSTLGSFYTHFPGRFVLGVFFAVPVLSALGVEAWREPAPVASRLLMVLPAVIVWGILAPVLQSPGQAFVIAGVAAVAGTAVLVAVARSPGLVLIVPVVLAVELVVNGMGAQRVLFPTSAYLQSGPIASYLMQRDGGRYLSLAPGRWGRPGYHVLQRARDWPLLATQRSMIYDLEEAQGYNPAQLPRYWTFVRATDPKPMRYNAAGFTRANPIVLDLLAVAYLIQPTSDLVAIPGAAAVATERDWVLYALPDVPPRASVLTSWSFAGSATSALRLVLAPGFDPDRTVVVEADPHPGTASGLSRSGSATFEWTSDQSARVTVDAPAPSVVLVRNTYAPGWRATVDGDPAQILPADYVLQGIPVPAGRHVIELAYREPTIGYGLAASAIALTGLMGTAAVLAIRRRRARSTSEPLGILLPVTSESPDPS